MMEDILNESYGTHERNIYDLYFAKSTIPTPLVIYIHGGGFTQGSKEQCPIAEKDEFINNGISFATINYPFITQKSLQEIMMDIARAVQYFKYNANKFNINKEQICCFGESAGAGASFFLATTPDLCNQASLDPVLHESSTIFSAGLYDVQSTYDFYQWPQLLNLSLDELFITQKEMGNPFLTIYGIPILNADDFELDDIVKIRSFLDMNSNISASTPPLYVKSSVFKDNTQDILHSQIFSQIIYDTCVDNKIKAELYLPEKPSKHKSFSEFMMDLF